MIERGVFRPYWLLRRREWATPVTCAFLHADLGHLFFNGFTFWAFGFSLGRTMGGPQFAAASTMTRIWRVRWPASPLPLVEPGAVARLISRLLG